MWGELVCYFKKHTFFTCMTRNVMIELVIQKQLQPRGVFLVSADKKYTYTKRALWEKQSQNTKHSNYKES